MDSVYRIREDGLMGGMGMNHCRSKYLTTVFGTGYVCHVTMFENDCWLFLGWLGGWAGWNGQDKQA
jgi:hypothetical protein